MSKKIIRRTLSNGVVIHLEEVPYEQSPAYWLEKNRDLLEQREESRQKESKSAWESCKDIIVGGPSDKTN